MGAGGAGGSPSPARGARQARRHKGSPPSVPETRPRTPLPQSVSQAGRFQPSVVKVTSEPTLNRVSRNPTQLVPVTLGFSRPTTETSEAMLAPPSPVPGGHTSPHLPSHHLSPLPRRAHALAAAGPHEPWGAAASPSHSGGPGTAWPAHRRRPDSARRTLPAPALPEA